MIKIEDRMTEDLKNLVKELNKGKLYGASLALSKMLKISDVAIRNWFIGRAMPSETNINKIAKKLNRKSDDIQKIFIDNSTANSFNKNSFNSSNREIELLKKEIELKDKEIYLLKKEIEMLKK